MQEPVAQPRRPLDPIIVCPLRFEMRRLVRELRGHGHACDVRCCGPGADATTAWARGIGRTRRPVILAGLAGALDDAFAPGSAHVVTGVCVEGGAVHHPPLRPARVATGDAGRCVIASTTSVLRGADRRVALAASTGAQLVDMESSAFAEAADARGWRWAIVRGVSDGPSTEPPAGVDRWVDASGRSRPAAVLASLLSRPRTIGSLVRLRRHGVEAMAAVAETLLTLVSRLDGPGVDVPE